MTQEALRQVNAQGARGSYDMIRKTGREPMACNVRSIERFTKRLGDTHKHYREFEENM